MKAEELRKIVEDAIQDADSHRLWMTFAVLVALALANTIASYVGAYLASRGKNLATKKDFQQLLEQHKKTTIATEEIRSEVLRRSTFYDKVLLERYNHINSINDRLETVRINFERLKKGQPTRIEIVNGETLLLTEIYADLQLKRAVLTPEFYDLLSARYDMASTLWQHQGDEWTRQLETWFDLNGKIQNRMAVVFRFGEAKI